MKMMFRDLTIGLFLMTVMTLSPGCLTYMCSSETDHLFAAYGGRCARADMACGRVGSIFDPAEVVHGDCGPEPIAEPTVPWPADVMDAPVESTPGRAIAEPPEELTEPPNSAPESLKLPAQLPEEGPDVISPTSSEIRFDLQPPSTDWGE